jgi:hypothetical protein
VEGTFRPGTIRLRQADMKIGKIVWPQAGGVMVFGWLIRIMGDAVLVKPFVDAPGMGRVSTKIQIAEYGIEKEKSFHKATLPVACCFDMLFRYVVSRYNFEYSFENELRKNRGNILASG